MLILEGCVRSDFIVMLNPATGELKEGKINFGASFFPIAQTMIDNIATQSCASGYQAAG